MIGKHQQKDERIDRQRDVEYCVHANNSGVLIKLFTMTSSTSPSTYLYTSFHTHTHTFKVYIYISNT